MVDWRSGTESLVVALRFHRANNVRKQSSYAVVILHLSWIFCLPTYPVFKKRLEDLDMTVKRIFKSWRTSIFVWLTSILPIIRHFLTSLKRWLLTITNEYWLISDATITLNDTTYQNWIGHFKIFISQDFSEYTFCRKCFLKSRTVIWIIFMQVNVYLPFETIPINFRSFKWHISMT